MTEYQWKVVVALCKIVMKYIAFSNIYRYESNREDFKLIKQVIEEEEG